MICPDQLLILDVAAKLGTIALATIALFALRSSREAVRAPVRPALDFVGFRVDPARNEIRMSVMNVGAGPAIDATCRICRGRKPIQEPVAWGYVKPEGAHGVDLGLAALTEGETLTIKLGCKDVFWKTVKMPNRRFKVTKKEGYYSRLTCPVLFPEDRTYIF